MRHTLYIMAALMLLAASCTEDIDLDIKDTTGTLCVNGFLYSDCDSNVIYVTKTGVSNTQNVLNASVKMYVNGVLTEEKSKSDNPLSSHYSLKTKFQPGDLVRIEVDCDGQRVWSESTAPQTPKDFDAKVTLERGKTYYDIDWEEFKTEDMYRLDVTFTDLSADKNYYRLYTNKDAYKIRYQKERTYILDSIYVEEDDWYEYTSRDTTYFIKDSIPTLNSELYIRETPELVDEEMTANNQLLDMSTYNYYKIFTNERFAGGKCNLKVYERVNYGGYYYDDNGYKAPPETQVIYDEAEIETLPEYNYTEYVGIEAIDEDTYFYVKALNGFESGNFDEQELTGAVKMRRNVHGGSGNISIISRVVKAIVVYDHYKPKPILKPRENNDENYYYGDDAYKYYDE